MRRYNLFFVFLGGMLCMAPASLQAQTCPNSSSCNAVVGSVVLPSVSTPTVPNRLVHGEEATPDGLFTDNLIGLTYNRSWNSTNGFARDDISEPLTWLGLESWWAGSSELNIDLSPPNSTSYLRPFSFQAKYDGTVTGLGIGGHPYAAGAAGVLLQGGTGPLASLVSIMDQTGRSASNNMLTMTRQNGTSSFAWRSGGVPRLNFALNPNYDANAFGNYGIMKFAGEWDHGEPLIEFEQVGTAAVLLQSYPTSSDSNARFKLLATGQLNWGSGAAPYDTDLYRSAASTLRTDGNLVIGGNLMVSGSKAAVVRTASFGVRQLYAVESLNEWFEDFGMGKLSRGRTTVRIDPVFAQTVTIGHNYHVFLTPTGACSLFVEEKMADAFTVRSLRGSKSCGFDYRIVAKQRGAEERRLVEVRD
jgi:hypothetical protein